MVGAPERLIESLGPRMHQGLNFGWRVVVVVVVVRGGPWFGMVVNLFLRCEHVHEI